MGQKVKLSFRFPKLCLFSPGHCWTRPLHRVRWHEVSAPRQVNLKLYVWGCNMSQSERTECFTSQVLFILLRVRLVERGAPQSLPVMESGNVSIDCWLKGLVGYTHSGHRPREYRKVVAWSLKLTHIHMFCSKILPGVRVIIVNPETRGPLGDSHLGEVSFSTEWHNEWFIFSVILCFIKSK